MPNSLTRTLRFDPDRWAKIPNDARTALLRSQLYRAVGWGFVFPEAALLDELRQTAENILAHSAELAHHTASVAAIRRLQQFNYATLDQMILDHDIVFGHTISAECPPYETQYAAGIIFAQAQRLSDVAAFYRAFGMNVAPDARERADHIAAELEFMSVLTFREATAIIEDDAEHLAQVRDAQQKFLTEHLSTWALSFAERLARKARRALPDSGGFYARLAGCLDALIRDDLVYVGIDLETIAPVEPVEFDFEPEGSCFACGPAGEPVLQNLPGFEV